MHIKIKYDFLYTVDHHLHNVVITLFFNYAVLYQGKYFQTKDSLACSPPGKTGQSAISAHVRHTVFILTVTHFCLQIFHLSIKANALVVMLTVITCWLLQSHPDVIAAGKKALDTHGAGLSSVRFICGTQVSVRLTQLVY